MKKMINYDEENDILSIHKGFSEDEKFKGNIDAEDVILDISTKNNVQGIEMWHAIDLLKEFNVKKEILENLTDADFDATIKANSATIGLLLKSKKKEIPAKIAVPLMAR